ncbi:MAG: hypothetical protein M1371_08500 [Actinobacteria bacterium]|nr:hypothetical protein [Actinomycetota bacterium]
MRPINVYFGHEKGLDFQVKLLKLQLTVRDEPGYEVIQAGAEQPDLDVTDLLSWLNSLDLFSKKALFLLNIDRLKAQGRKGLINFIEGMMSSNQRLRGSKDGANVPGENEYYPQSLLVLSSTRPLPPDVQDLLDSASASGLARIHKVEDITRSVIGFIKKVADQVGKQISTEAAHMLLLSVQTDPLTLRNEILKLAAYTGSRENIDVSDIRLIGSKSAEFNAFDFQDMLNKKELGSALFWLGSYMEGKHEGELISLVFLLYSNYRKMLEVKSILKAGKNIEQMAKELGIGLIRAKILASESKGYTEKELVTILEMLIFGQYKNRSLSISLTDCLKEIALFRCKGIRSSSL